MISRRSLFGFLGMGGSAVVAPLATNRLLDAGRRITHLPNGGMLIEDEEFATGISIEGASNLTMTNCIVTATGNGIRALKEKQ